MQTPSTSRCVSMDLQLETALPWSAYPAQHSSPTSDYGSDRDSDRLSASLEDLSMEDLFNDADFSCGTSGQQPQQQQQQGQQRQQSSHQLPHQSEQQPSTTDDIFDIFDGELPPSPETSVSRPRKTFFKQESLENYAQSPPEVTDKMQSTVKQEPLSTFPFPQCQAYPDFLQPTTYTPQAAMFMNTGFNSFMGSCGDLMPPPITSQPNLFPPNFFYPPPIVPVTSDRRGSHGTTSSSSTSHAGTPSPHPTSPTFPQQLNFRIGAFPDLTGALQHNIHQSLPNIPEDDTDKLCAVCNDRAVCLHYGARTCEGCKGFFKRTVQKKAKYMCAGDKNCPIDKRYRSRCQYCRFQKCLAVGMVKEIVRHGSLSGRRGRLSSKTRTRNTDEPPSPPLPLLSLITRAFEASMVKDPRVAGPLVSQLHVPAFFDLLETEYRSLSTFARRIPTDVPQTDFNRLLARAFWPALALKMAFRFTINGDDSYTFESGERVPLLCIPETFRPFFCNVHALRLQFRTLLDWEHNYFAALLALVVFNNSESTVSMMENRSQLDQTQSTIVNALKDICTSTGAPLGANKLSKIVSQVEVAEGFAHTGVESLTLAAMQFPLPPSLESVRILGRCLSEPMSQAPHSFPYI